MKRVFIVHGWEGSPEANWLPWMKKELEGRGFQVIVPRMPDTEEPKIEPWVSHLRQIVGTPDADTYFIGHSIGCQAIIRYLQNVDQKVGGVLYVAGWLTRLTGDLDDEEKAIVKPWIESPINYEAVRNVAANSIALFSDNDEFVSLDNVDLFSDRLRSETKIEHNKGHFTGEEDGVMEFPVILETFLKLMK